MNMFSSIGIKAAGVLSLGFAAVVGVRAQNPFVVSSRVELTDTSRVLHVAFAIPTNHVLYADKLSFRWNEADKVEFETPKPTVIHDKFSGKEKNIFAQSFDATHELPAGVSTNLLLTVHFQGCDEANCYFPVDKTFSISPKGMVAAVEAEEETPASPVAKDLNSLAAGFDVKARGSGYLNEKDFMGFLNETEKSGSATTVVRSGFFGGVLTALLIVLGGVALNLTPCILPMIPINLAIIGAGAQAGSRKRGFALGATYAAGMAIAYGVLGVVVVLTGAKFGTLNSSPWFNLSIAAVFLVLALAMFDLIAIDLSRFQNSPGGGSVETKSKFILAYTMGTVAALLAGACVAPVVISVLLQAANLHNRGVMLGLLLPFLLGVGMGLPWPFAGAGLSFLPKPGMWMVRVKYGFGVLIALFATYYGYIGYGQMHAQHPWPVRARHVEASIGAAPAIDGDLRAALEAAKADGRPVLVDFYASWCKNCSAMEHTTFASEEVKKRLGDFHFVRMQAERPNQQPAKEILDQFQVMGLPSYVILKPKSGTVL